MFLKLQQYLSILGAWCLWRAPTLTTALMSTLAKS
jgi:hypothetical protein